MTAPDELATTYTEWANGPYRLSADESRAVMARLLDLEASAASAGDPSRTSRFEYRPGEVRTVTTTCWRAL